MVAIKSVAQEPQAILEHYSTSDGLISNAISDIIQDKWGFIWISTWNGLNRFDGFNFTNYNTGKASGIKNLHNRILNLQTDTQGNIWMLMYDNRVFVLNRHTDKISNAFDNIEGGESFHTAEAPTEDKYRQVDAITISNDGYVYINIPERGLYQLYIDGKHNSCRKIVDSNIKTYNVSCDTDGNPWIATKPYTIKVIDKNTGIVKGNYIIKGETVNCIKFTNNSLYIGTESGKIIILNIKTKRTRYLDIRNEEKKPITSLYIDQYNLVWFSTTDKGISRYNPKDKSVKSFRQEVRIPENDINGCKITETGNMLWARMNHGGFGLYNRLTDEMQYFHNNPDNSWNLSNTVTTYIALNEGIIWMSTIRRGLEKLSLINSRIKYIIPQPGTDEYGINEIRAMLYDNIGKRILISNKAGQLIVLDKNSLETKDSHVILNVKGRIYGLNEDHEGNIWISTKGDGIYILKKNKNTAEKLNMKFSSNNIYNVVTDNYGNIWVATYDGGVNVILKKGNKLIVSKSIKGYPQNSYLKVRDLEIDNNGNIWAGTSDGILILKYNKYSNSIEAKPIEQTENEDEQIANCDIIQIEKAHDGSMWIATNGGGLAHCIGQDDENKWKFENIGEVDGIPSGEIKGITISDNSNIWFSCDQIICAYDPVKKLLTTLSSLDGIENVACSECSAITLPDGRMLFGTLSGYYIIDKDKLTTSSGAQLRLAITDFYIDDKLMTPRSDNTYNYYVPDSDYVELPSRTSVFAFKFASLNYQMQHRVHYQYILEGYDDNWHNAEDKFRMVSYSNVPAGKYKFKVKAFLLESPEKYNIQEMTIVVPPYMLASPLALWIYAFSFIGSVIIFIRWRKKVNRDTVKKMRVLKVGPDEIAFQDNNDFDFVKNIQIWLETHYAEPNLKIDNMVKITNMSRTAFYTQLKTLTGMSPKEFISDFRLKKACMYLKMDNSNIAEVAYKTGFNDPVYFTRLFKQKIGITPTQYRNQ